MTKSLGTHTNWRTGSSMASMMRRIEGMCEFYKENPGLIGAERVSREPIRKRMPTREERPMPRDYAGLYLRAYREGLSLCGVARKAGMSAPGLYNWARARGLPTTKDDLAASVDGVEGITLLRG